MYWVVNFTMLEKKVVKTDLVSAVFLLILVVISCLVCFTSAARDQTVVLNGKNMRRSPNPSGFRQIKPSCNSRNIAQCSPPPRQMDMNMSNNTNVTGAEKRVVPTGPNPLHNR